MTTGDVTRQGRRRRQPWAGSRLPAAALALLGTFGACGQLDSMLEVELPGQVVEGDLDNPALAETLVRSAQGDFECGFQGYLMVTGSWAGELHYIHTGVYIPLIRFNTRSALSREYAGPCKGTGSEWNPTWAPLQLSRGEAATAAERVLAYPEGSVANRDFLVAKAKAYEAYSTLLLSEAYCGIVLDGDGQVRPRADGFRMAETLFTETLQWAAKATGANAAAITNLAYVGRARARLNLGDKAGVLADAAKVPMNFAYLATYDATPSRRQNHFDQINGEWYTIHPSFRALTVNGVPDPRVPTVKMSRNTQTGAEWWEQRKYTSTAADIPFATGREALLMIAEVSGGQAAVDVINRLRATHSLPAYAGTDPAAILAQVYEERRRELFQQGTKMGDDLRSGAYRNWDTTGHPLGRIYGTETCMPVPEIELL